MRIVAHGTVWFDELTEQRVLELMRAQSSASRSAYQAIHKHHLVGNDVKKYVKKNYMTLLNQRYIADAVSRVAAIENDKVVFGGRKLWDDLISGDIAAEEWRQQRNDQLYSRGDRTKDGNPNLRVVGDKLLVNDPENRGKWLEGKLFIPEKWKPSLACYEVRLLYLTGRFEVKVSWEELDPPKMQTHGGAIGVDINPDGVAVCGVSSDGNLLEHHYDKAQRIQFAEKGKRDHDVKELAKTVVAQAKQIGKQLVIEKLSFKQRKAARKFQRTKHNFLHRQITQAVKLRAVKEGVPVVEVNPACTSILGQLKYQKPFPLNRHTAAALVIARRGMGFLERRDFTCAPEDSENSRLNLEGRGFETALTWKAYSFLVACGLKKKSARLTASELAAGSRPATDSSTGETPVGESNSTTGRVGSVREEILSFFQGDERLPSRLGAG